MKIKALIPMLVGVGIGLLALKMGWGYIERQKLSVAASQGNTPIVVAKFDLAPGTLLKLSDFTTADWPRSTIPGHSYSDTENLVGRVNSTQLIAGLPVLENMLAPPGSGPGLPSLVPPGFQAMTVKVDEFGGVAGFIKPGDKVDVVATFSVKRTEAGGTETVTRTILRDIIVCAVGQAVQPDENNAPMIVRSITLQVKPYQAQKLSLASTRGTIRLSLRSGQGPSSATDLSAISFSELLRGESDEADQNESTGKWVSNLLKSKKPDQTKVVPVKVNPRWEMKIYRGPAVQELAFENSTSSRRLQSSAAESTNESATKLGVNPDDWKEQDVKNFNKLLGQKSWPSIGK